MGKNRAARRELGRDRKPKFYWGVHLQELFIRLPWATGIVFAVCPMKWYFTLSGMIALAIMIVEYVWRHVPYWYRLENAGWTRSQINGSRLASVVIVLAVFAYIAWMPIQQQWVRDHSVVISPKPPSASDIAAEVWKNSPLLHSKDKHRASSSVGQAQMQQLQEIDRLLGMKEEYELREMFAFHGMIRENIAIVAKTLKGHKETGDKSFAVQFAGREMLYSSKIAGSHLRRHGGGLIYDGDPLREVAMIVLPREYTKNNKLLSHYQNSSLTPRSVSISIKDFSVAIADNAEILITVLDNSLKQNPDYFLLHDDPNQPYWNLIQGKYFAKFIPLRPKADKIRDAIKKVLDGQ